MTTHARASLRTQLVAKMVLGVPLGAVFTGNPVVEAFRKGLDIPLYDSNGPTVLKVCLSYFSSAPSCAYTKPSIVGVWTDIKGPLDLVVRYLCP